MSESKIPIRSLEGHPLVDVEARGLAQAAANEAAANAKRVTALTEEIAELKGSGSTETVVLDIPLSSGYYYGFKDTSSDYNISEVIKSSSTSLYTPTPVDLGASAVGKKLRIISNDYKTDSGRYTGFCKTADGVTNKNYGFSEKNNFVYDEENQHYVMEIPIYTRYLYISLENRARPVRIEIVSESSVYAGRSAYVSVTGSDENGDGSNLMPFATVSKALSAGFEDIVVKGGVYRQRITIDENSRNHDGKRASISPADPDGRVIFVDPDAVIATDETHVSGKVYSATTDKMFADGNVWISQDGVQDASTLISDAERHPLERGMEYRCEDTKIERCAATTLSDALTEIESADTYKWYAESGKLYFSRPQAITEVNPLCGSFGNSLLNGFVSRARTIELIGIESKYMAINVDGMSRATLKDCKSTNVYGDGAFTYNQCASAEFVRCEAARCYKGTNGDGFNAHSSKTGNAFSKQTTALFVDCWSHDNCDDGYSDHERSETTIIGGLYEYNGKAGVTPSYGSHCTCYNVISRRNYSGFYCAGTADEAEGGKYTQMVCMGCVSENNVRGGSKIGFRLTGAGNSAMLIGCKSIGHSVGYSSEDGTKMRLVDCGSLNDATVKSGSGIVIENTTLVS